jgi:hypothetical protein
VTVAITVALIHAREGYMRVSRARQYPG